MKGETLSQVHQQFNCFLIGLKTIGTIYPNSEVVTKFMESLPESWETYTMCLTMSCDIKTLSLSELYGRMINHEQTKQLKNNLLRDNKDSKSTSIALVSKSIPLVPKSLVVITKLDPSDSDYPSDNDSAELDESLALLTNTFRRFLIKATFRSLDLSLSLSLSY